MIPNSKDRKRDTRRIEEVKKIEERVEIPILSTPVKGRTFDRHCFFLGVQILRF